MRILFIALTFFLVRSLLPAQTQNTATLNVSLFAFEYADGHQNVFLATSKKDYEEITLSTANIRGPFKTRLTDEGLIALCEKQMSDEGEEIYPLIAEIKVPKSVKEPLVILFPSHGKKPYHTVVIDRSMSDFPAGSYKLINFSKNAIRASIGNTPVTVAANKITVFNPSSNSDELLDVHFQYFSAKQWRTFGRTRWVNDRKARTLLCAFADERTKRMKIRGIPLR